MDPVLGQSNILRGKINQMISEFELTFHRDHVLFRMARAINRWDLRSGRNINYRSFSPIIRLARVSHTPECQLWAVWALANLTTVTPEKYCQLVVQEGGHIMVEEMLDENSDQVKELARTVR